jgi:hypothetical protein
VGRGLAAQHMQDGQLPHVPSALGLTRPAAASKPTALDCDRRKATHRLVLPRWGAPEWQRCALAGGGQRSRPAAAPALDEPPAAWRC